jgi:hypothetical protein
LWFDLFVLTDVANLDSSGKMPATICPSCNALLSSRERALPNCPKCLEILPEVQKVRTLSDRKRANHIDRLNDQKFCFQMALLALITAMIALVLGCVTISGEESAGNIVHVVLSVLSVLLLIGCAVSGFIGLNGGIRNQWVESIILSALALIVGGVQMAFWLLTIAALFHVGD